METSQIFIENCNNVSDKIYDTVRVSLDSSVSFAAIEKIQNYYDTVYSRMQVDMSNIIMVFSFILGLFTICLGVKFVWDAFVAKKWYSDREEMLNNIFDAKVKEIQKDFSNLKDSYVLDSIMSYVKMGQKLYREANCQPTKEAFLQMYMALNFLLSSEYKKDYLPLYEIVVVELGNTFYYDDEVGKNLALDPLSLLKTELEYALEKYSIDESKKNVSIFLQKTENEDVREKIKDIIAKIDSILNRMESDSDMNHGDAADDETDDSRNAGEPEPSNVGPDSPADVSEMAEETADETDDSRNADEPEPSNVGPVSPADTSEMAEETEIQKEGYFPLNEKSESVGEAANNVDAPDNADIEKSSANHS